MKIFSILYILIVCFFGFTHFVDINDSYILIPKLSFTYSDTFITVDDVIARYNQQNAVEKLRSDPRLENLVRVLQSKQLVTIKSKQLVTIKSEPEPILKENLPKPSVASNPSQYPHYPDVKSAILDGNNAVGKTINFYAEFREITIASSKPVLDVHAETETGSAHWYVNFDDSYRSIVSGLTKNQRLDILCTISKINGYISTCELIKFRFL